MDAKETNSSGTNLHCVSSPSGKAPWKELLTLQGCIHGVSACSQVSKPHKCSALRYPLRLRTFFLRHAINHPWGSIVNVIHDIHLAGQQSCPNSFLKNLSGHPWPPTVAEKSTYALAFYRFMLGFCCFVQTLKAEY